jgi:hypothetical protein
MRFAQKNFLPGPTGFRVAAFNNPGQVAQSVERSPEKAGVGGSIPSLATIQFKFRQKSAALG